MNKTTVVNTLVSAVGGALIGGGVTFLTVKRHFKNKADLEVEDVRRHYALIRKDANTIDIFATPSEDEDVAPTSIINDEIPGTPAQYEKAKALIAQMGYDTESLPTTTIFGSAVPDSEVGPQLTGPNGQPIEEFEGENADDPMSNYVRISGEPYIISMKDYFDTEPDWEKSSLSFYESDDTLIDERQQVVDNRDKYIGDRHLSMFGVLSEDKKVVYVRNAQISTDFEIILERGKYTVEVLGLEDEDVAEKTPIRRMRASD